MPRTPPRVNIDVILNAHYYRECEVHGRSLHQGTKCVKCEMARIPALEAEIDRLRRELTKTETVKMTKDDWLTLSFDQFT